ncbi:MAG: hypothetical protein ACRBFS_06010 [Aureispira sp.]
MKRSLLFVSVLAAGFIYCLSSCTADKLSLPEPTGFQCSQITITYEDHVRSVLNSQCNTAGCHDDANLSSFGSYQSMNQARREYLYTRVCITKDMPPAGGLALEYIDTIRCWAEQGYLEN